MGFSDFQFPQQSAPANLSGGERGISSLYHPEVGTFRFRSNPKEFNWSYTLNKRVDQTYGGRVIQLLGTRIDDFTFRADSGSIAKDGGWPYANRLAGFMRNIMIRQRGGVPATFEYTTRGWKFNAYVVSVPFADAVEEVLREFEVTLKVQEDVTGVMSRNTLSAELSRLQDGMGFRRSKYNDPMFPANQNGIPQPDMGPIYSGISTVTTLTQSFLNNNIPARANAIAQARNLADKIANPPSRG